MRLRDDGEASLHPFWLGLEQLHHLPARRLWAHREAHARGASASPRLTALGQSRELDPLLVTIAVVLENEWPCRNLTFSGGDETGLQKF